MTGKPPARTMKERTGGKERRKRIPHWRYIKWLRKHGQKHVYPSRGRAWLSIFRIWLQERRIDSLQPYACYFTDDPGEPRGTVPHIHIGHGRVSTGVWIKRKLQKKLQKAVSPLFRARSRTRTLAGNIWQSRNLRRILSL